MSELAEPMALVQHTPRTSRASPNLAESWLLARSHGSNNTCIIGIIVHHTALACPSSHIFFLGKDINYLTLNTNVGTLTMLPKICENSTEMLLEYY
jgi:hypothetical protein